MEEYFTNVTYSGSATSLLRNATLCPLRPPKEIKKWWSSPEEERLAIDELRVALDKQENDIDYNKKIHETVIKLVDEFGCNENFQKMIKGLFTPPVCVGDNSDMQDELEKLLETIAASNVSTLHK